MLAKLSINYCTVSYSPFSPRMMTFLQSLSSMHTTKSTGESDPPVLCNNLFNPPSGLLLLLMMMLFRQFIFLKYACPVIAVHLACFFTACFRHGFIPHSISDCVLSLSLFQKVVKMHPTVKNYRPIALASTLSKVIEHIILLKYRVYFPLKLAHLPQSVQL